MGTPDYHVAGQMYINLLDDLPFAHLNKASTELSFYFLMTMVVKPDVVKVDAGHIELAVTKSQGSDSPGLAAVSPEAERSVLRKLDFLLMPLILITLALQYVDKTILNGTAKFGIIDDLHLYEIAGVDPTTSTPIVSLHRFSVVTLIFYWGYLAASSSNTEQNTW